MDRMNTYSAYKPTSTVGDDDTSKYHLYWKIDGLTQDPISGFAQSGELFAFLGLNSLKNSVLKIVSGMSKPSCAIEKLYLNGRLLKEHKNFSYIDCSLQDHMYDNLTVLETLIFSAELRQLTPTHGSELSSIRLLTDMGLEDTSDERVVNLSLWKKRLLLFGTEVG
jgi:ABC-type multidrug transport system ATPase subunit